MDFKNISKQYRPIPFWSWNDKLDPEELRRQIREMHAQGIGGFFMHARGGLQTEYLSAEWIDSSCMPEVDYRQLIWEKNGLRM